MIHLNCSAKARKNLGLKPSKTVESASWHEEWRLDILDPPLCGQGAIFTNHSTFFSFLVPCEECNSFERVYQYFITRLQFTLIDAKSKLIVDTGPPLIVSGNPRSVIGTVNDMKFALDFEDCEPAVPGRDPELFINRTPYKGIDYDYPVEYFYRRAKESP
jgi:hypothetical protein